jgi:MFS transporter, UMF1 family
MEPGLTEAGSTSAGGSPEAANSQQSVGSPEALAGSTKMVTAPKRVINGWAMYDWANSVYNLVITTTFFPMYFVAATKKHFGSDQIPFLGRKFENSSLYSYSLAAAYLLIALLYPILTSVADTRGNKKSFMQVFCYMGAAGCSILYFFDGSNLGLGIMSFMLASMGYVGSLVFYNAYLPEIAIPEDQDRVSAKGYAYGYIGSVILQIIGFILVLTIKDNPFMGPRITFLLTGIWWAAFAQITFAVLPKVSRTIVKKVNVFTEGFAEIKKVYAEVKKIAILKRYLRGFFFYSMGVQTVMMAATLFGSKLLGLEDTKLIVTVVLIQLIAIAGAMLMSRLSNLYGNIKVLMGVVAFWILICVAAYLTAGMAAPLKPYHEKIEALHKERDQLKARKTLALAALAQANARANGAARNGGATTPTPNGSSSPQTSASAADPAAASALLALESEEGRLEGEISRWEAELAPKQGPIEYSFYLLALAVGLVMGGIQSLSRSTYSKLMPETKDTASYFSYYDLTEKIAIVIGMFSFGFIDDMTGSMKNALIFLIIFFVIGLVWLYSALAKQNELKAVS